VEGTRERAWKVDIRIMENTLIQRLGGEGEAAT
jgi:hypothetical protein